MTRHTQTLGVDVQTLAAAIGAGLADRDGIPADALVDSIVVPGRHPNGLASSLVFEGRVRAGEVPANGNPLGATVAELRRLIEPCAPRDRINSITRDTDTGDLSIDVTAFSRPPYPEAPGGAVLVAPVGTPPPTSVAPGSGDGWVDVGYTTGDAGITETPDPADDVKSWPLPVIGAGITVEMQLADPEGFHAMLRRLEAEQDDAILNDADRAVDAMDLDRLSAELRLMLPEPENVVALSFGETDADDHIDEALDEYSADAVIAWFREEVAAARRRAYRTGIAFGRAARDHQEPTA